MIYRKITFTLILVGLMTTTAIAEPPTKATGAHSFYGFEGGRIFAKRYSKILPVVAVERRGLIVETAPGKTKRVSFDAAIELRREFYVSENLINIERLNFQFRYKGDASYLHEVIGQMHDMGLNTDIEISALHRNNLAQYPVEAIQALKEDQRVFEETVLNQLEEGEPGMIGLSNAVILRMTLQPEHDVSNAMCALILTYHKDSDSRKPRTAIRVKNLGSLQGGVSNEMTFQADLSTGRYDPTKYHLYLFTEDAEPLPTTKSSYLKQLTPEELEAIQQHQLGDPK